MTDEEVAPETTDDAVTGDPTEGAGTGDHTEGAVTGDPTDDTQAATASAPAAASTQGQAGVASASEQPAASPRAARKVREGVVVSNGMDKTAVVAVIERVRHPKYNKFVLQTKKLYAHDEANDVNVGDRVRVMEMRPLSKTKRWRVTDVLERAK
jgi:small subunit ribosomal protein S17